MTKTINIFHLPLLHHSLGTFQIILLNVFDMFCCFEALLITVLQKEIDYDGLTKVAETREEKTREKVENLQVIVCSFFP